MKDEFACNMLVIMGHEYSGVSAGVGEGIEGFQVGNRVISMSRIVHWASAAIAMRVSSFCVLIASPSIME